MYPIHKHLKRTVGTLASRSKLGREDIKWQELLQYFRSVQSKHEKARRQALGTDMTSYSDYSDGDRVESSSGGPNSADRATGPSTLSRVPLRRRVTGELPPAPAVVSGRPGALSPLNPRARGTTQSGLRPGIGQQAARTNLNRK